MFHLFTDGSADPESKTGFGAYLLLPHLDADVLQNQVQTKRFEDTSSSRLELETLLWALEVVPISEVIIYTDSQTIVGLEKRRARLEKANFCNKKGILLQQADLYRAFFEKTDSINCRFIKQQGHLKTKQKTNLDRLFSVVDKAARNALRDYLGL